MTADEQLNLLRIKIERAKEHVRALEEEIQAFLSTTPYVVATKRDPQSRRLVYYIVSVRETPIHIAAVIGDVIQNLRSALDHLAYHLVVVATGATPQSHVYFPIADNAAGYARKKTSQTRGMSADALRVIDALQPYKGGNDTLWQIHKLNIVDKHRMLLTVGSAFQSVNVGAIMHREMTRVSSTNPALADMPVPAFDLFLRPADRLFPLKTGAELFIDGPDAEPHPTMQFMFDVAFGEPGIIEGEPLVATLKQMVDTVDQLMPTFKPYVS